MQITSHSKTRIQQRGIQPLIIKLLEDYGSEVYDHRGAVVRYFSKADKKRMARTEGVAIVKAIDSFLNIYTVTSADGGTLITVGHNYTRKNYSH